MFEIIRNLVDALYEFIDELLGLKEEEYKV